MTWWPAVLAAIPVLATLAKLVHALLGIRKEVTAGTGVSADVLAVVVEIRAEQKRQGERIGEVEDNLLILQARHKALTCQAGPLARPEALESASAR